MIDGRRKGAAGEREFCEWIAKTLELDEVPTRNLEQTRSGGADILGVFPFIFEVKRVEKLQHRKWWLQVCAAAREFSDKNPIPVVAYRQNRKDWCFLISASYIGLASGYIHLDTKEGIKWLQHTWQQLSY